MVSVGRRAVVCGAMISLALGGCELHKGKRDAGPGGSSSSKSSTVPQGKGPKIVFAETAYDAGKLTDTKPVSHVFKFKNMGGDTLLIKKVGKT